MGLRYACGRGTRLRHSTALEWDELEKKKKKRAYQQIKYSTGENAAIKHCTGTEFDWKAMRERPEENERSQPKVRSKPIHEDDRYLELHTESIRAKRRGNIKNQEHKKETEKTGRKKVINKSVKKMIIEY